MGMFYRRKLILALLESFERSVSRIEMQKYLFLLTRGQDKPAYDFIPYRYGCYSFTAASDISVMQSQRLLVIENDEITKACRENYINQIENDDQGKLIVISDMFRRHKDVDALMRYVYTSEPYYAVLSTVKERLLTARELERVHESKPVIQGVTLATIGYEGVSIEAYINKLIKNDIRCLIDVRKNPQSMKFGFSQKTLRYICEETGIRYVSIKELGIDADKRNKLETQKDYNDLFDYYISSTLNMTEKYQLDVLELLDTYRRVALTCFEKEITRCHRSVLADYIVQKYRPVEAVQHIQ